ncbi:MAG: hypothetical protein ACREJO_10085 [Phycisphaerales bacterium]
MNAEGLATNLIEAIRVDVPRQELQRVLSDCAESDEVQMVPATIDGVYLGRLLSAAQRWVLLEWCTRFFTMFAFEADRRPASVPAQDWHTAAIMATLGIRGEIIDGPIVGVDYYTSWLKRTVEKSRPDLQRDAIQLIQSALEEESARDK